MAKSQFIDLTGRRFGRLSVVSDAGRVARGYDHWWTCLCDCGNTKPIRGISLRNNRSVSCGCGAIESNRKRFTKHGMSRTPEYSAWSHMIRRCNNPDDISYPNYGAIGVTVCIDWIGPGGFENFIDVIGLKPKGKYSIDRINPLGNYEPGNVRWADDVTQARNKRNNRILTVNGVDRCLTEWAAVTGLKREILRDRVDRGWAVAAAVLTPAGPSGRPKRVKEG